MVGFAPGCGDGAVGERAAAVAGGDGFADVGWEDPGGAADVEDSGVGAEQDGEDVGVAGDFADGVGVDRAGEGRGAGTERIPGCSGVAVVARGGVGELLEEVVVVDGDGELGSESAVAGQFPGGHGHGAGADEAVEEFLGAGAPVQVRAAGFCRALVPVRLLPVGCCRW